jgi:hypothetical protein
MNERIKELAEKAGMTDDKFGMFFAKDFDSHCADGVDLEKFAELIVRECIKTIEYRAPGQMGKEGEGWTNGYDDGLKTGAWLLKEHFGVDYNPVEE